MKEHNHLESFLDQFGSDESCHNLLFQIKWGNGYTCRKCGHKRFVPGRSRFYLRCRRCHYDESTTANTLFHKIKFPLRKAFGIVYQIATMKKGMSTCEISRQYDITRETAWFFRKKIQIAMRHELSPQNDGRLDCNGSFKVVSSLNMKFQEFSKQNVKSAENYRKKSDSFNKVSAIEEKKGVKKKIGRSSERANGNIQARWHFERRGKRRIRILDLTAKDLGSLRQEFMNFNLRIWILGIHHRVSVEHLHGYFDEFFFRLNNRHEIKNSPGKIICSFMQCAKVQYAEIIAK